MYVAREISREKLLSCGFPGQIIIEIIAGEVRSLGYMLVRDPDECDDSHVYAHATHPRSSGQFHKDRKKLAEAVNKRFASGSTTTI